MPAPPTAGLPAVRLPGHTTAPTRRQVRPTAAAHTTAVHPADLHRITEAVPHTTGVRLRATAGRREFPAAAVHREVRYPEADDRAFPEAQQPTAGQPSH